MPIFEYRCAACGHDFEELVLSASAEHTPNCPGCGSEAVQKRMSCFSGISGAGDKGATASQAPACGFT